MDNANSKTSSLYTILVQARNLIEGPSEVDLPGYELWMTDIKNVYVIPEQVDVGKFRNTLNKTLQFFPHAAGTHDHTGTDWKIIVDDYFIRLEIQDVEHDYLQVAEDDWVIQPNLARFYAPHAKPGMWQFEQTYLADLLRIKLTRATKETAVGVSWHHTLGDAFVLSRFMQLLSQNYQSVDQPAPLVTFDKKVFSSPDSSLVEQYAPLMRHLARTYPTEELPTRYAEMSTGISRVAFRVTEGQLSRLRETVCAGLDHKANKPSTHACLVAYIIHVLNRYLDAPIDTVTNAVSYRNVPNAVNDANVAGNAIFIIPATLTEEDTTLLAVASKIHASISVSREISFVEGYMSVASTLMKETVEKGHDWLFDAPPGRVSVNSHIAIDWHSAHFGFPGRTRFYTSGVNDRYIRIFWSNVLAGSEVEALSRSQEVFFGVAHEIKDKVFHALITGL